MSKREIKPITWHSTPNTDWPKSNSTPHQLSDWLVKAATTHDLRFGLVHADDGVIWGQFDHGVWTWSSGHSSGISPKLQEQTLQQLRVFGPSAEVLVWREDNQWRNRLIKDEAESGTQCYFDEPHVLWGKPFGPAEQGFQLLREGAQGLLHAPPVALAQVGQLTTRNYVDFDEDGCAFVCASRLTLIETEDKKTRG
jgi:CRISPR-associated protein (TIGR03984 family)